MQEWINHERQHTELQSITVCSNDSLTLLGNNLCTISNLIY